MLRQARRVALGAFLALIVSATAAAAECAWVLWTRDSALLRTLEDAKRGHGTDEWGYTALGPEFFDTRDECEMTILKYRYNRRKSYEDAKKAGIPNPTPPASAYQCLPDTVDPRGPKGGGR